MQSAAPTASPLFAGPVFHATRHLHSVEGHLNHPWLFLAMLPPHQPLLPHQTLCGNFLSRTVVLGSPPHLLNLCPASALTVATAMLIVSPCLNLLRVLCSCCYACHLSLARNNCKEIKLTTTSNLTIHETNVNEKCYIHKYLILPINHFCGKQTRNDPRIHAKCTTVTEMSWKYGPWTTVYGCEYRWPLIDPPGHKTDLEQNRNHNKTRLNVWLNLFWRILSNTEQC